MAYLTSDHDKALCKRCNIVGKTILSKIRTLVEELEELIANENGELDEDIRCIMKKNQFKPPLITFPEEQCKKEYHIEMDKTVPVWDLRRYPSTELIGGDWSPCLCAKSNGLTEDCRRRHCRGRAGCFTSPPSCPASRRWTKPITTQQINQILSSYNTEKLQPCDKHTVWDPTCYLCRYYINRIDNMVSGMCAAQ